jgi:hypothetical protein
MNSQPYYHNRMCDKLPYDLKRWYYQGVTLSIFALLVYGAPWLQKTQNGCDIVFSHNDLFM